MEERNQEHSSSDSLEDMFEPMLGDMSNEDFDEFEPAISIKQQLAEKRRRAERRLEQRRLRDELGCYDLELDDF